MTISIIINYNHHSDNQHDDTQHYGNQDNDTQQNNLKNVTLGMYDT